MNITIQTGAGGFDIFDEMLDNEAGYERIYISKIPRILKGKFRPGESLTKGYFRRIKMAP